RVAYRKTSAASVHGRGAASINRAQLEPGKAEGNVDVNRTLERDRLQRKGASGTAHQDLDAGAEAEADFAGGADIFAGERPGRRACGRRKYRPAEHAAGADAEIDADGVERALIGLRREGVVLGGGALR